MYHFLKVKFQRNVVLAQIQLTMSWNYTKESPLKKENNDFRFLVKLHVIILVFNFQVLLVKEHFFELVLHY